MDCDGCAAPDWYECQDSYKTCIHHSFICDGEKNCFNGEDELNCESSVKTEVRACNHFEFTCVDKTCIPLDFVCDGKKQCPDNSDETLGCEHAEITCEGFFCLNKKCLVSHQWVCDGFDDCGDGSDEHGCAWNCKLEQNKFLCKDNDSCISLQKVCDGAFDCGDKSDEGKLCKETCNTLPCPNKCIQLPSGPTCVCDEGFKYNEVTHKCDDINECDQYGICSQVCTNTNGSYHCSCMEKFKLKNDNRTCTVEDGEPLMLFATHSSIMGMHLHSKHVYKVVEHEKQIVGVAYDGLHIYWTQLKSGHEAIIRAREDGTKQEIVISSGLDSPEDLAVDWLTGNIYFTDNAKKHIAVCTNHGEYCKALVHIDVDFPRGIALFPQNGQMFWTDWGEKPMIATAYMDGTNFKEIITKDIRWPNCITIDYISKRIYWADAKFGKIENAKFDGTDRKSILHNIAEHPYGIAVFEDRLYWSDWQTYSINMCDKLDGKNHEVIFKDYATMYDVHIYHSSHQPKLNHACKYNSCSHICLLSGTSAKCACPQDMILNSDARTCSKTEKSQKLFLGLGNKIYEIEDRTFGRLRVITEFSLPIFVDRMEYNNVNGTIFLVDNQRHEIAEFDPITKSFNILISNNLGNVSGIAFDHLSHNIFWADCKLHTIEMFSLQTRKRALVHFYSGQYKPMGIAVKPELGQIYVALNAPNSSSIHTLTMEGHIYQAIHNIGAGGIQLYASDDPNALFWLDEESSTIEFRNYENMTRKVFHNRLSNPTSMTKLGDYFFWSQRDSKTIYWSHKSGTESVRRLDVDDPLLNIHFINKNRIFLLSSKAIFTPSTDKHKCLIRNGGCSHICAATGSFSSKCICPPGFTFKDLSNMTCIENIDCEYHCQSGECITLSRKCNGKIDCVDESDESDCEGKMKEICRLDQFRCHDGTKCIENSQRCDKIKDCPDSSDEDDCAKFDSNTNCHFNQFRCDNTHCIDINSVCDSFDDCGDNSDEKHCSRSETSNRRGCSKDNFQCAVGSCIPKKWECDGHMDCIDASDEHENCQHSCPKGSVQCRSGQCIDRKLICDGNDDCGDNTDEQNCEKPKETHIACAEGEDGFGNKKKFQCTSNLHICLDLSARCNGTAECPRGEDENDCGRCSFNEFECVAGMQCIRIEWLCDGTKDCNDGSDEVNCQKNRTSSALDMHHHTLLSTNCDANMFSCRDGSCIERSKVCDDTVDCANGSDEGSLCKTACKNNGKCEHICTPTPYGALCSCKHGYHLNNDKKSCSDIDECFEEQPCAQICDNLHGSYRCSCYSDYLLRPDKVSCKSIESGAYLLFSSFDQARVISENPISIKLLFSANESKIEGLDVDVANKRAYFTAKDSNTIFEYNLNKSSNGSRSNGIERTLIDFGRLKKLAVDWVTGNIYVVVNTGVDYIKVCNFKDQKCARIVKLRARDSVKAIAVDAINRHLFYSVTYFSIFGSPKTILYKASLDGQKQIALVSDTMYITSMDLDINKQIVYYIDFHTKTLQSIDYKTVANRKESKPKVIIKKQNAFKYPSGLSVYENVAFIINTGSPEAIKCELYGKKNCHTFNLNVYNAEHVVVVGQSRQPKSENFCKSNKCSVLCVHAELGAKCICYNGERSAVGEKCPLPNLQNEFRNFEDLGADNIPSSYLKTSESKSSTFLISFSCAVVVLISSAIAYLYYRRQFGRGNFSVNMHFQNPLSKKNNNNNNNEEGITNVAGGSGSTDLSQQQHHMQIRGSPSVSTRYIKNNTNFVSKLPLVGPMHKILFGQKYNEISMESSEAKRQQNSIIQSAKGSHSLTYKTGTIVEPDEHEYSSRDLGDFDDDPRAQLVP